MKKQEDMLVAVNQLKKECEARKQDKKAALEKQQVDQEEKLKGLDEKIRRILARKDAELKILKSDLQVESSKRMEAEQVLNQLNSDMSYLRSSNSNSSSSGVRNNNYDNINNSNSNMRGAGGTLPPPAASYR